MLLRFGPEAMLVVLLAGSLIGRKVYQTAYDKAAGVFLSIFFTVVAFGLIAVPYFVSKNHRQQRIQVEHILKVRYPDVAFTRVWVVDEYLEFHPKDNPDLKCNANLIHAAGAWYVKHGSVDCGSINQGAMRIDQTNRDLNNEIKSIDEYTKEQHNPTWLMNF